MTLFGALLGVLGALTAVPLAAMIQIFLQELTTARREKVAEAKEALEGVSGGATGPSRWRKAGGGNRTLVISLEGWGSTIELHPRRHIEAILTGGRYRDR